MTRALWVLKRSAPAAVCALWLGFVCGCSGDSSGEGGSDGTENGNGTDADGTDTEHTGRFDTDSNVCDEQGFEISAQPVSLMILIDRSSSMVSNAAEQNRWQIAVAAIEKMLTGWIDPHIAVGVDVFPDGSGRASEGLVADCGVSNPVQLDCAPDNAQNVLDVLDELGDPPDLGNQTPMWCGLNNFNTASYADGCRAGGREAYVVMLSDGSDTCGLDCNCLDTPDTCGDPDFGANSDQLSELSSKLLGNGVHTMVIGFGGGVDAYKLNGIAKNGGTDLETYMFAENEMQLEAAFQTVSDAVIPCTYELKTPDASADPDQVNFYFGDDPVPFYENGNCDTVDGWVWKDAAHTEMSFCGTYCTKLKSGSVDRVTATFGCPSYVIVK